ncbi:MAG: hypothetical protein ABL864_15020 [Terricaulis sp.]
MVAWARIITEDAVDEWDLFLYRVYGAQAKERLAEAMSALDEIADAQLCLSYEATMNVLDTFQAPSAEIINWQKA